jgi:type II secretion system protein D
MKRQIYTTLTGAVFASFLLVLPQITSAAEEAEESASTQTGATSPAIEQPGEGMILEDKDNGKIVILEDPTADEITVERTSIVTPGEAGEVEVKNVLVVSAPSDEVADVEATAEEEINSAEKGDSTWLGRFFSAIGLGEDVGDGENNKTDPNHKFRFLYHDKYEGEDISMLPQSIREEMISADRETTRDLATPEQIEAVETPILPLKGDEDSVKKPEPFYEELLFEEEMNGGLGGDEEIAVNIAFNSAPIMDVIPAFADALGFNFVIDTDIRSFVTLNLNSTMTKRDLWAAFATLIENAGVTISVENSGQLLRILPPTKLGSRAKLDESEICFYPLNFGNAQEVINQIRPFLSSTATCIQVQRPNAVLLVDSRDNIRKLSDLLAILDENPRTKWARVVVPCENILPSKIAEELREVLPTLGFVVKQLNESSEQPGSVKITSVDRLQLIIASAATREAAQEIRNWIEILDGTISLDQERVFVHKVMYTKSEQLMQALAVLYNMSGTSLTIDTDGGNRTQSVNGTSSTRNNANNNRNSAYSEYSSTTTDQKSNIFETPVKIFSDGALNRLIIRTTPRTYASIKALLDRLDVVPAQVLLQVSVAEVTLSDETKFGLELAAASRWGGENMAMSTKWTDLSPDTEKAGIKDAARQTGYTFMLADPNDPKNKIGYLRALAGNSKFKIVASPQVLVSSNTEATINVGESTPYVGNTVTNTSSSGSLLTSTSFKDSGIKLIVTPQVTSTDLITLKLNQTLSSAQMMTVSGTTQAPKVTQREVKTSMTIHNGQTMIIGGLIQENGQDKLQSLPFLNEIPILRRLLGNTDSNLNRTEILIMITGHIINEKSRVEDMIRRYNDALEAINDFEDNLGSSADGKHKKASSRMFTLD